MLHCNVLSNDKLSEYKMLNIALVYERILRKLTKENSPSLRNLMQSKSVVVNSVFPCEI